MSELIMVEDLRATAYHNWGRWVADCPNTKCNNAEDVVGQTFFCGCQGSGVCGHGQPCRTVSKIVWPENVEAINHVLSVRPVPSTRNWTSGETLEDLRKENADNGLDYT